MAKLPLNAKLITQVDVELNSFGFFGHDSNTGLLELKLYKSSKSVSIETKQVVWPNYRLARSDQLPQSTGSSRMSLEWDDNRKNLELK